MASIAAKFENLESILVTTVIGRTADGELAGAWAENGDEIPMERSQIAAALRALADGFDEKITEIENSKYTKSSLE